jgi:hypothetical protein
MIRLLFDTFDPRHPTHWVVALVQLLHFKRYWWVVHTTMVLPFDTTSEVVCHLSTVGVQPLQTHDRELFAPCHPDMHNPSVFARRMHLLTYRRWFVNCATLTSGLCSQGRPTFAFPADVYADAVAFTSDYLRSL